MIIELLDGTTYNIADYGMFRLFHFIPSAEIQHNTQVLQGGGEVITGTNIRQRTISVEFGFKVVDIYDYYLLRDELNALFLRQESFYITFEREPYKRWLVKTNSQYQLPPHPRGGKFSIDFRTVNRFAEAIANTNSKKEWDEDVWWWNGVISWDDPIGYEFTSNEFTVINLGTYVADPTEPGMKMVVDIKATSTEPLVIHNLTNGSKYTYNGVLSHGDILKLDGVRSLKNGISVFKETSKTFLKLSSGPNNIKITGGTVHSVSFDFRFPFL